MDLKIGFHPVVGASGRPLGFVGSRSLDQKVWPKDHLEIGWPQGGLDFSSPAPVVPAPVVPKTEPPQPSGWLRPVGALKSSEPTQVALPRRQVSQLLTVAASLRRVSDTLSPETRRILEKPEIPAVLAGILPAVTVPVDEKGFDELMKVADGLSVATGRSIEIGWDPDRPGTAILVHNDAVDAVAPHLVNLNRQLRFQWQEWNRGNTQELLGTVHLGEPAPVATMPKGPIAILDPELGQKQSKRASQLRDCQAILEKGCGARQPVAGTPRNIGMISYVSSDYQFQRLTAVLQEWKNNLEEFGHHHVTMRLCDDSPSPFSERIQTLLQEISKNGLNRFVYTGPKQKAELSQELERELGKSLPAEDAAAVAKLVAGAGPTQNRNLSLQLLGAEGGLQIDHDMTAEVLTKHFDKPLPYDLLGSLEGAPQNNLSSLRFCGAEDHAIETIVGAALPEARSTAWLTVENREPEAPARVDTLDDADMGGGLRAPMNVPSNFSPAGRISPGLRDGDLALGLVAENVSGQATQELNGSIFHRDTAGSRWGGASLLKEFLKFATVYYVYEGLRQNAPQTGQQLSEGLQSSVNLPATDQLWCYESSRESVGSFLRERQSKVEELKGMLDESSYPRGLEKWAGQPLTPEIREQSTLEVRQVIGKLEAESQEMHEKLHLDKDGQIDVQALQADLHGEVRQILRTHALALAHSQQISSTILSRGGGANLRPGANGAD